MLNYTQTFDKQIEKKKKKDKALMEEAMKKVERLQEMPYAGKLLKYRLAPYRSVRVKGKYRLVYRVDEEKSIGICIEKIQKVFNDNHIDGEIIVSDNSTDRTPEIARNLGAKVIVPDKHGYGNAYRFGFEHASGDYIVMGDEDNTYDFTDIPRLLEPLKREIRHRLTLINTDLKNNHLNRGVEA